MKHAAPILAILGGLLLLFGGQPGPDPDPEPHGDIVSQAFETYRTLWINHNLDAAARLRSGELTTGPDAQKFIAAGQEPARRVAFEAIATAEQQLLADEKWTAEKHAELLESYAK